MARGVSNSFIDFLAKFMQLIGEAKMSPDADLDFLAEIEGMIIERVQNPAMAPLGVSAAGAQPGFSAQQMQPQQTQQAPTRLPSNGTAPGGEVEELSRVLQGS